MTLQRKLALVGTHLLVPLVVVAAGGSLYAEQPISSLREATATVDGTQIHYRIGGNGPPLLLLHGFTLTSAEWDPFLPALTKWSRVIAPDLPGHGGSASRSGPFSYRATARVFFGLLDSLGIERIRGIGHSAGSITLIHMAAQQPSRVESMILVAGAHRLPSGGREIIRASTFETMEKPLQEYYLSHHPGGRPQIEEIMGALRGTADNHEDFDFSPEHLSTLPTRALLVWGDADPIFPVGLALEMHKALPNSALWVVPNQGHAPIWEWLGGDAEASAAFPRVVQRFLETGE